MKLHMVFCAYLAVAMAYSLQTAIDGSFEGKVPGDNPFKYCANPEGYGLLLDRLDLVPNPPQAGENLTINATGDLKHAIGTGSMVQLQVKLKAGRALIPVLQRDYDLCDLLPQFNLDCPVPCGDVGLESEVEFPSDIPKGNYLVLVDAFAEDQQELLCLETTLSF